MNSDEYRTIKSKAMGLYREKGSKFISLAFPVSSVEKAMELIEETRKEYHDARHHCWAYLIGLDETSSRINDDGEPSGTAGNPILGQIRSFDLTNILVLVVRYFGGTKLGVGGLINAYRTATKDALVSSSIVKRKIMIDFRLDFRYSEIGRVMKLIKTEKIPYSGESFESDCSMIISLPKSETERISKKLYMIDHVSIKTI